MVQQTDKPRMTEWEKKINQLDFYFWTTSANQENKNYYYSLIWDTFTEFGPKASTDWSIILSELTRDFFFFVINTSLETRGPESLGPFQDRGEQV